MIDMRPIHPDARAAGASSLLSAVLAVLAVITANLAMFAIPAVILLTPANEAEAVTPAEVPEPTPYVVPVTLAMAPTAVRVAAPLARRPGSEVCEMRSRAEAVRVEIARPVIRIAEAQSL